MAKMDNNAEREPKLDMCDGCKDALGDVDHGLSICLDLENESIVFEDASYRRQEDELTVHQQMTAEQAVQLGCKSPGDVMRAFHGDSGAGSASVGSTAAYRNNYDDIFSNN